ncbi:CRISPR-associated protein Cas5 [Cecembia calidifontis]|uniref:CRISPR-associated Cas5h family protein n=1 Tax=Cecembia calidifontis TaxID=1187080 RepID=A0A4Q7PEE8_9BACT|nr:CRISPR-associated protein Cas5 [Cecembia calidifontis]RZS98791.1 CRISPR-associated Cas5h family protein [Cecembia calidifontis]
MDVLSFDICGKFAHFRKFHANNTALSYSIPPRTTIIGIIAGIMGREKNSYYEEFSSENMRIGIRVVSDIRKSFHRLNYLMIKSKDDFTGKNGRVQTPFEVITGNSIREGKVVYRVFISDQEGSKSKNTENLQEILINQKSSYNASLGLANFNASIENVKFWQKVNTIQVNNEFVNIHSACNSADVSELEFLEEAAFKFNFVEEELLPADFKANNDRELKAMNRVLYTTRNFPLRVKLKGTYHELKEENEIQRIQFLENVGILTQ